MASGDSHIKKQVENGVWGDEVHVGRLCWFGVCVFV